MDGQIARKVVLFWFSLFCFAFPDLANKTENKRKTYLSYLLWTDLVKRLILHCSSE